MHGHQFRFDLFAMLEWTAAIALLCALLAGGGSRTVVTHEFAAVPPDDKPLTTWLAKQQQDDVRVRRKGNSIVMESHRSVFRMLPFRANAVPSPPWSQLGYGALRSMQSHIRPWHGIYSVVDVE